MLSSAVPTRFELVFGQNAGGAFIRVVPFPSQIGVQNGAASFFDGFPPLNFSPITSGGVPPFGQDANGILKAITQWNQWQAAGGPVLYDATFSAAIGGYPQGATLMAATFNHQWLSIVENNTSNPDSGGAGWVDPSTIRPTRTVASSAPITLLASDYAVGFNRITVPGPTAVTLPTSLVGKEFEIADLSKNCNAFPITITPPGGQSIASDPTFVMNENKMVARLRFYGGNLWSIAT